MLRRILAFSLFAAAMIAGAIFWWIRVELHTPYYGAAAPETFLEISPDTSSGSIVSLLVKHRIVRFRIPLLIYLRYSDSTRRLQAGEYRFSPPQSPVEITERLVRGDVYSRTIMIPEGLDYGEVIDRLVQNGLGKRADFEKAMARTAWIKDLSPSARNLEGFLFPDTYRFGRKVPPEAIVRAMVDQFRLRWHKLLQIHPLPKGWDAARIVTLASIIEKETGNDRERPIVASVLVNRLERRIPLAVDPTIIYALKLSGPFDGNLHKSDLSLDSPYNTYLRAGLPPGPISNPGSDALAAALAPDRSAFLFYVSRNDGTHHFSADYKSHLAAVAKYQKSLAPGRESKTGSPSGRK